MNIFSWSDNFAPLIGRIIMGSIFLISGMEKALDFEGTVELLLLANTPFPIFFAVLSIAVGVLFGIALVVGFKTRLSATVLLAFTALVSVTFHTVGSHRELLSIDLAMIAGLLYMMTFGSGQLGVDTRKGKR